MGTISSFPITTATIGAEAATIRSEINAVEAANAAINALLEDNPADSRTAINALENNLLAVTTLLNSNQVASRAAINAELAGAVAPQVIENFYALNATFGAFHSLDYAIKGSPAYVGITGFGDSMANVGYTFGEWVRDLIDRWGLGAVCSPNLGGPNRVGAAWSFTGGAAIDTGNFNHTPAANWILMPAGSTASFTQSITDMVFKSSAGDAAAKRKRNVTNYWLPSGVSKVSVYYVKDIGSGTLGITVSQSQQANKTATVDCNGTYALAKSEFVPDDFVRPITVSLSATSASVTVVGVVFWGADGGVIAWDSSKGGSTMTQQLAALSSNQFKAPYVSFFAELNTSFVFHNQRVPGDENWQANYPIFFNAYSLLNSGKVGQLVLAEPPRQPELSPTVVTINEFLRAQCRTSKIAFVDSTLLVGPYSTLATLGWDLAFTPSTYDGVHLGGQYYRYMGGLLCEFTNGFASAQSLSGEHKLIRPFNKLSVGAMRDRLIVNSVTRDFQFLTGYTSHRSAATGTGYSISIDNYKGVNFNGGATGGYAAALLVPAGTTISIPTSVRSMSVTFKGYRNVALSAGHRAAFIVGGPDAQITNLSELTGKCFGLEMAIGSTLGISGINASNVYRIFSHDGSSLSYSAWVGYDESIFGGASLHGISISLVWDRFSGRLYLYLMQGNTSEITESTACIAYASLAASAHASAGSALYGGWVHGLIYSDGVNTPSVAGSISVNNINLFWGGYDHMISSQF